MTARAGLVRVGLLTDGLSDLRFPEVLAWCVERRIEEIELGFGGYSRVPHADLARLGADSRARESLMATPVERGRSLSTLNASGDPLHPDNSVVSHTMVFLATRSVSLIRSASSWSPP